jgi:hypothetical protein
MRSILAATVGFSQRELLGEGAQTPNSIHPQVIGASKQQIAVDPFTLPNLLCS